MATTTMTKMPTTMGTMIAHAGTPSSVLSSLKLGGIPDNCA